jgi:rod shape-determining protein MreB and related proteins
VLGKKVGIDLGSDRVRAVVKGEGVVVDEPSVVALIRGTNMISAFGKKAAEAADDDDEFTLVRPIRGARVADPGALGALVTHVVNRAAGRQRIFKPDVVVAVHSSMPGHDRLAVLDALSRCNARTEYLIDMPVAAGLGAGMSITGPVGHMVVDLGAACAEVAVIASEGTISGRSVEARPEWEDVAILIRDVVNAGREVFAEIPQVLLPGLHSEGAVLVGGRALADGIAAQLSDAWGLAVHPVKEPQYCSVRGAQIAVDSLELLKRSFMYIR